MTVLEKLENSADVSGIIGRVSTLPVVTGKWDNKDTWDNQGGGKWDNRSTWDNWNK